ncbi:MAG: SusD/RagB family nutrient-binding outer membrane lipoprotein [Chitinophagales bacterium]|nr:SusD/RagB family nutrient-binding outer membrane lipoprotein [Chitinophagales bacterium]
MNNKMKLKKIIYMIPLAAIVVATGCRKSQFNINQNTNSPTDSTVTYDVVLPAALHASGTIVANQWGSIQNWMGYWARSGTYAPNVIEETYQITTGFGNGIWNNCYDNNYDYQIVQTKAAKAGAGFYEGIARIMKAHNYQILVDVYGNVPYSEALKGGGNPTPKYDNGIDIYKDLFREIDAGIALIKAANTSANGPNKDIAKNDIMFGGNKTLWAKFGNTLKLRLLIHAYAVAGINKAAEITIINNEGSGYLGVGENAQVQPGYAADKPNPFYNNYKNTVAGAQTANNVYFRANKWGIDYYAYNADNRRSRVYEAGANGYVGVAYGLPPITDNAAGNLAGIGPGLYKTNTSPQCIMSSAESFFLQAEARIRGFITTGADVQTLMTNGINESFAYLGAGSAAGYISGNAGYSDVDVTAVGNTPGTPGVEPLGGIFTVLSQKWFALNGINTLEVWCDYRRVPYKEVRSASTVTDHFVYGAGVGYDPGPPISVSPQNTSTKIPVRYLYPQTEYNYNAANVGAQGNVDPFTSRIFWDLN